MQRLKRKPAAGTAGDQECGGIYEEPTDTKSALSSQGRWNKANPVARYAHSQVAQALKRGELTREPCFVCGDPNSEAHHRFHELPLAVTWLCRLHYRRFHAILRKAGVS
jgi:hypothetical protein